MRDRSFRERVYRSVFAALEKKISESAGISPEEAQRRRDALKHRIVQIERELVSSAPAVQAQAQDQQSLTPPPVDGPASPASSTYEPAPEVELRPRSAPHAGATGVDTGLGFRPRREAAGADLSLPGVAGDLAATGAQVDPGERRRRPWGILLMVAVVLSMLGIGTWWAYSTGLFGRDDGSVPNPPTELEEEDYQPGAPPPLTQDGSGERPWVTVFGVADADAVRVGAGASVEPIEDDGQSLLRLRSGSGGSPIEVPLDRAALAAVAGGSVVFDVVARAQEGQETQISISCDFGTLGDCGRRRYVVGLHRSDFLFDLELGAGDPPSRPVISIVTDVEGEGRAIDLFEIRIAPSQ